jgi:DNA-binding PadR family transcriptional regulator
MPITLQQKKAIGFNQAGWRSAKHLRQASQGARGKPGVSFLNDLSHAKKAGWVEAKKPEWAREKYYRRTEKGRAYLAKHKFTSAIDAFCLSEVLKLSASRAELQRLGWYSIKHVGAVNSILLEKCYYQSAVFLRAQRKCRYYRLTPLGKQWAKSHYLKRLELELKRQFKELRAWEEKRYAGYIADPEQLVQAWSR